VGGAVDQWSLYLLAATACRQRLTYAGPAPFGGEMRGGSARSTSTV